MYQTITQDSIFELTEKKSKFIGNLIYIKNKEEANEKIKEIKKKYFDARHNCFAFRVLEDGMIYEKSSDDGEPSGTAGNPMLSILQKNNLCNVLIVVTRYFGGILLGTGGLVRCYSGATIGAIENVNKAKIELGTEYKIQIEYSYFENLKYYCQKKNIRILQTSYEEFITCIIVIKNEFKEEFLEDIKQQEFLLNNIEEVVTKYYRLDK